MGDSESEVKPGSSGSSAGCWGGLGENGYIKLTKIFALFYQFQLCKPSTEVSEFAKLPTRRFCGFLVSTLYGAAFRGGALVVGRWWRTCSALVVREP